MSQITSELLKSLAPRTPAPLRDRFLAPLNLLLPLAYFAITTEYRVAAFLATACAESDWFKTMREYGKGKGRAYGKPDAITGLIYYGRGIFQNTWKSGYKAFTDFVRANWSWIQPLAGIPKAPDFVLEPELLATEFWAVLAACWFWKVNGLQTYADRGLKGFFGLQGRVNRGNAKLEALHYNDRLSSYEAARRITPDDFLLVSAAAPVVLPATDQETGPGVDSNDSATSTATQTPQLAVPSVEQPPSALTPILKKGSSGTWVKRLQLALRSHGELVDADGSFGPATEAAVKKIQQASRLKADGIAGPRTYAVLGL